MLRSSTGALLSRFTIPAIGLAVFALLTALYIGQHDVYQSIMTAVMKVPFSHAFTDWIFIPSEIECWAKGVDVYVNNPCYLDIPTELFNYSPLWLRATFIPNGVHWTQVFGFAFAVLFFASLASLPQPGNRRDFVVTVLASLSSATALAIERANVDVLMFLMIIAGVNVFRLRPAFRLAGYGLITLAGLLKFYPMVALIAALRERTSVFLAIAVSVAAVFGAFLLEFRDELVRALRNLPPVYDLTLQFGAVDLPVGLRQVTVKFAGILLHQDIAASGAAGRLLIGGTQAVLTLAACIIAISLVRRGFFRIGTVRLPKGSVDFMVVGAALICGCFFAGQNVLYRGIYLLLALPGLLALSHLLPGRGARAAIRGASFATVFVLWAPFIEWCLHAVGLGEGTSYVSAVHDTALATLVRYVLFVCDQSAWWWIVTILLALVIEFVVNSETWAALVRIQRTAARIPVAGEE